MNLKKLLCLLLALCLIVLCLVGCRKDKQKSDPQQASEPAGTSENASEQDGTQENQQGSTPGDQAEETPTKPEPIEDGEEAELEPIAGDGEDVETEEDLEIGGD